MPYRHIHVGCVFNRRSLAESGRGFPGQNIVELFLVIMYYNINKQRHIPMKIHFITSNAGKVKSLQDCFNARGRSDIQVVSTNLNLIEPQADTVADVSLFKARQAYQKLRQPLVVEDGGFAIDALNGFPGVYTKYSNCTIGAAGIIKLMMGETNRRARFISTATYIDAVGNEHQFHRRGGDVLVADRVSPVDSPLAWSVLWKIIWIEKFQKVMCEMTPDEVNAYGADGQSYSSLNAFVDWFVMNNNAKNK